MDKDIFTSKRVLLDYLGIRENFLYNDFTHRYHTKEIPKKNGEMRPIRPPQKRLKELQRKILQDILSTAKLNGSVYGLEAAMGIVQNAEAHQCNHDTDLVALDIAGFFPSVTIKSVRRVFKKMGFDKECASVLAKICTVDGSLPQGAPTSPILSALVLEKIDKQIFDYCRKNQVTYTRYFDDITLSGKRLNKKIVKRVEDILTTQGYTLNGDKKYWYLPTQKKVVTSVVILPEEFSVTDEYLQSVRQIYNEYLSNPSTYLWNVLMGKMAFYLYVNRSEALRFFRQITGVTFRSRHAVCVHQ